MGSTLHRGARASRYCGLSCCGAQAPDAQAQQLWLTGPVAPRHVGSSQTRARTRVPRIGRRILNHCATREAPVFFIFKILFYGLEAMCCVSFFQRKYIINSIFFYQNLQLFRISIPLPNQKGLYHTIYWTLSPISLDRAIENYRFIFFPKILL